jgi:hypothetical protein
VNWIGVLVIAFLLADIVFTATTRRTLAAHQRHLDALSRSVGNQARHLAAHDGGLAPLRQEARR